MNKIGRDGLPTWTDVTPAHIGRKTMAGDFEQKIGDPAENHRNVSRNAQRLHGWPLARWIIFIRDNPECTLPGGVAGALVAFYTDTIKELVNANEA